MPIQIRALGYTLKPGERFIDQDDCIDEGEDDIPDTPAEQDDRSSREKDLRKIDDREGQLSLKDFAKSEINLKEEILAKIQEIELKPVKGDRKVPWIETLCIIGDEVCNEELEKNQTLKIEEHFKDIALNCVKVGLERLKKLGIPFNRPADFYAEMLKSDNQMNSIMKKVTKKQELINKRRDDYNRRVKNKFNKKVKQLQNKNKFIKDVGEIVKNRGKDSNIQEQIDRLIKKYDHKEKEDLTKKRTKHGNTKKSSRKERKSKAEKLNREAKNNKSSRRKVIMKSIRKNKK